MINKNDAELLCTETKNCISEDRSRLVALGSDDKNEELIVGLLKKDQVVLVQGIEPHEADSLMYSIAAKFGLAESLEVQAAFASSKGHRENIGRYYMSVNKRKDYQFIPPHSEGGSFSNLQLASFYCYENSTDGGETILMNVDQSSEIWGELRELLTRGKATKELTRTEIEQIKVMAHLNMPEDVLKDDDEILKEIKVSPYFTIFDVLAKPRKTYSRLLDNEVFVYWDTIESVDYDSVTAYSQLLEQDGLLKLPPDNCDVKILDDSNERRVRHFGSDYEKLFKCKITRKLQPGEFIIQNNLTWAHSVSNWTPGSGFRKVAAAFA
ncbi:TauD/TfdA family dioxygenase [Aliikangiella coralliicola]|uniref:Uncharacterized protein n=1 Tax=Aliikangiella coralliicola TaxID=2592383 RepID=A0A545TV55_9GAMM|nr:TauD/TfdA family dioxygenase [Aliikangiella coralliicola]TQV81100.1 hypothetical protein FLL46_26175 [Aliikangiella coralliicola]